MMILLLDKSVLDEQNYNLSVSDEMHLRKQKKPGNITGIFERNQA